MFSENHYVESVQIRSFYLVRISLYSVWIQENTDQKKTPYLDTFHAAIVVSVEF